MGDRANIAIRESWPDDLHSHEAVFLYSHWGGHELPETLREALAKHAQWEDPTYLARVIFNHMTQGSEGTTGFGISTRLTDNEYPLLVLFHQRVYLLLESTYNAQGFTDIEELPSISFEDYISKPRTWDNALD